MAKQCNASEVSLMMSARAIAAMLGVSIRQVWRLNATGKLPRPIRLGGSVKWKKTEIMKWFDNDCPDRQTWDAMKEVAK
jgi:predicted DNA-binding transcriptional regulator AlpA